MAKGPIYPRDKELLGVQSIKEQAVSLYTEVKKGFEEQRPRADEILDYWDHHDQVLTEKQFYSGNTRICLPFVHDAVKARVTRFTNQIFPQSGRFVEVTTGEADPPQGTQALVEHRIRQIKAKTMLIPPLIRNGDCEGQYTIYVDWSEHARTVVNRVEKQPTTAGLPNEAAEPVEDLEEEEEEEAGIDVELIADPDLLILPVTADTVEKAFAVGGSVTILRRWSKGKIKQMIADDKIDEEAGEELIEAMSSAQQTDTNVDIDKMHADHAGIRSRGKVCNVYETWSMLKVGDKRRLCRIFYAGDDITLSIKQNPYWHGRCPVITTPVEKIANAAKGKAPITYVADLHIFANDTINEGADTAHFSAMPIVMTDPVKNPRVDLMVLGLGAVWETSPQDTQIVEFPDLWKSALERAAAIKEQIFQTLGVNPAMMPQSTAGPGKKRNQAELALENQIDLMTTADSCTVLEEGILTPLVTMIAALDAQFRDKEITVRTFGELGARAVMERIEPLQLGTKYEFRWLGVEAARNAAQMQAQTSWLNVVRGIPADMYPDYELDVSPMLVQGTETVFGPRLAPRIFRRKQLFSLEPDVENELLAQGFQVSTHPPDDDQLHVMSHMLAMQEAGDPAGLFRDHIAKHQAQMQAKAMQQLGQRGAGGPGMQQGAGASAGRGGPRMGASPGAPRGGQAPPGAVHKDSMAQHGAVVMPRKTA